MLYEIIGWARNNCSLILCVSLLPSVFCRSRIHSILPLATANTCICIWRFLFCLFHARSLFFYIDHLFSVVLSFTFRSLWISMFSKFFPLHFRFFSSRFRLFAAHKPFVSQFRFQWFIRCEFRFSFLNQFSIS